MPDKKQLVVDELQKTINWLVDQQADSRLIAAVVRGPASGGLPTSTSSARRVVGSHRAGSMVRSLMNSQSEGLSEGVAGCRARRR
jgi:hypothetical protein